MARNSATPVTFNFPDGDVAEVITWDFVLEKLDHEMASTLEKMYSSNTHLKNIADKLEEFIDDGEED